VNGSANDHHRADSANPVRCTVVTVSDTRTPADDRSGALMLELLREHGYETVGYRIVRDEQDAIREALGEFSARDDVDAILFNGGTGIAPRDVTIEALRPLFDKELPGFGELFRFLSFTEDVGSAAMLSRAIAGVRKGKAVFAMPGSPRAVRLAMTRLVLPELRHVVAEIRKGNP